MWRTQNLRNAWGSTMEGNYSRCKDVITSGWCLSWSPQACPPLSLDLGFLCPLGHACTTFIAMAYGQALQSSADNCHIRLSALASLDSMKGREGLVTTGSAAQALKMLWPMCKRQRSSLNLLRQQQTMLGMTWIQRSKEQSKIFSLERKDKITYLHILPFSVWPCFCLSHWVGWICPLNKIEAQDK